MSKSLLSIVLLTAIGYVGNTENNTMNLAQDDTPCAKFKMRVVKPPDDLDSKMVDKADSNLDQAMVINPCPATPLTATRLKSASEESQQNGNVALPSLKFKLLGDSLESGLKSPSEVLKQFATPTTPKPDRK